MNEDELLSSLLSVATKELSDLQEQLRLKHDGSTKHPQKSVSKTPAKNCNLTKSNLSSVHGGDTDSSDDEDRRNPEDKRYNECGKEIKHLLAANSDSPRDVTNKHSSPGWLKKPRINHSLIASETASPINKGDVYTDPVFGLRIINPIISSQELLKRMEGRMVLPFSRVKNFCIAREINGDFVIAGVIVNKSAVKTSQKGSQYSLWFLSDLKGDIKTISLFLFGSAHKQLWKTSTGSVIGILNPTILDKKDGTKDEVCKKFNEIGSRLLSRGFLRLEKRHAFIYKQVKSVLPRRESERRVHPLARHCDILQAVETRISMLNMTYLKYIENNLLCFVPGKVLDEIEYVLHLVENCNNPPRTHQLLQELRDLSSMAMEHFDEHILPRVKEQMDRKTALMASYGNVSNSSRMLITHRILLNELHKVKKHNRVQKHSITSLTQNSQKMFLKIRRQNLRLRAQSLKIREQERKLQEQQNKLQEQESTIADIKKRMEEWDQKYIDLTAELIRARDDILSKTSLPGKPLVNVPHLQPNFFKSNIKPRVAQVKICTSLHMDLERKRKSDGSGDDIPSKLLVYEPESFQEVNESGGEFSPKEPSKEKEDPYKSLDDIDINNFNSMLEEAKSGKNMISGSVQNTDSKGEKANLSTLLSSSIDAIFNTPCVKSRKRKLYNDIDLK